MTSWAIINRSVAVMISDNLLDVCLESFHIPPSFIYFFFNNFPAYLRHLKKKALFSKEDSLKSISREA